MAKKTIKFEMNPLLSGPTLGARTRFGSPYRELPISDIDVDPEQPRRHFDNDSLAELSASIKEHGVLCPVLVRLAEAGTYKLIAGERRLRASKLAGLETIPAIIDQEDDDSSVLGKQLVENLQRSDLTPLERAIAIGQLRDRQQWSIREIATHLGVSKGAVQRSLEVLSLPDELQAALASGASESKILLLAQVEDRDLRKALLKRLDNLTREQLEQELTKAGEGKAYRRGTKSKASKEPLPMNVEDGRIVEEIQRTLAIKVQIARKKDGQGRLILEFYSPADLYEIYRRLTN